MLLTKRKRKAETIIWSEIRILRPSPFNFQFAKKDIDKRIFMFSASYICTL